MVPKNLYKKGGVKWKNIVGPDDDEMITLGHYGMVHAQTEGREKKYIYVVEAEDLTTITWIGE